MRAVGRNLSGGRGGWVWGGGGIFCDRWVFVLGDPRTAQSKFSMPASYFRAPVAVKIERDTPALCVRISIFGRSGVPSKVESKNPYFQVHPRIFRARVLRTARAGSRALRAGCLF